MGLLEWKTEQRGYGHLVGTKNGRERESESARETICMAERVCSDHSIERTIRKWESRESLAGEK